MSTEGEIRTGTRNVLETEPPVRLYFLDNLKIFLAILVVLHHAAQPYGPGGWWWITPESPSVTGFFVLGIFMGVNASFFMGLFFVISAYFMPSAFRKKGAARFMKDRLVKFGVPILVFALAFFPAMFWLFFGNPVISLGHLWFLELLLVFSAISAVWWLVKGPPAVTKQEFCGTSAILVFITALAILSFIVRIWAPENDWLPFGLLEPFHIVQYAMLFAAGVVAYSRGWIDAIPIAAAKLWSGIAVLMVMLLPVIYFVTEGTQFSGGLTIASLIGSFWEAFMGVSMCIALLALFRKRFGSAGPVARAMAGNTFTVYLIQLPVVVVLQFLIIGLNVDPLIKFVIVGLLAVPLCFAISHFLIRRLPGADSILV